MYKAWLHICNGHLYACVCIPAVCYDGALLQDLESSLKQTQEKNNKLVKTVKAARTRIQELNAERDQV